MTTIKTSVLVLGAFLLHPPGASAQDLTMAVLKDPQRLAGEELRQLLAGAKVTHMTRRGATRHWRNNADGKFIASSDSVGYKGRTTAFPTSGAGTWHISPLDQYCVTIEWKTSAENWCMFIFKSGDKYFGSRRRDDPSARVVEFGFSK